MNGLQRTKAMRRFLSGLIISSGVEMQERMVWKLCRRGNLFLTVSAEFCTSIPISLPVSLSREKCDSNVVGKGRQRFARIELAFTQTH